MGSRTTDARVPSPSSAEETLRTIEVRLRKQYKSPRLGNPKNPLDDLVFVLLSSRTQGIVHERLYRNLKRAFPTWSRALKAGSKALSPVIARGGLGRKKANQIHKILRTLNTQFGSPTLRSLSRKPDSQLEDFLTRLPGVGAKTARCVMMYAFGRKVFPVDAHVLRILGYFGLVNSEVRQEYAQDPLQKIVPPDIRYSLHVNLVAHGRGTCLPSRPRCEDCSLNDICPASSVRHGEHRERVLYGSADADLDFE